MSKSTYATGVTPPQGIWWKPAHKSEKVWFTIAFVWCMILFAMMPLWHLRGGQNPSGIRARVEPADYLARVQQFVADYGTGETESGIPVVAPPPGADVYLLAAQFQWSPVLRLEQGAEYTLHLSSLDVNHGFNLYPFNVNFQVVPGYDYGLRVTPTEAGDYRIVCNEFCGIGHHLMVGKVLVVPSDDAAADADPSDGEAVADAGGDR
jgi:cytochrome c oxidase subunit 2